MNKELDLTGIVEEGTQYQDYEFPKVSVIIPTYNVSEKIQLTLSSVLKQNYPNFEVIIVDGGSKDRTLEVINNYHDERVQVYTVSGFQRYEMLNKGISQAKGVYINCLFSGDFYTSPNVLRNMMTLALDNQDPDFVYCGTLIRDGRSDPKILFRPLTLKLLKRGQQPTSLQSSWFGTDAIKQLGKFDTNLKLRGGFDLMCRFLLSKGLRSVYTNRVYTDYDLRLVDRYMIYHHFIETWVIILNYFGLFTAIKWLFIQKDFKRLVGAWYRSVKMAFIGR